MKAVLYEGMMVALVGAALSIAANALSPRGLQLSRNYFPSDQRASTNALTAPHLSSAAITNAALRLELLSSRLREKGIRLATSNEVAALYRDPRRDVGLIAFIDARDDQHYQAGHIPGACQLDYYRLKNYFAAVMQVCQLAQQIIVYCNGGDCEDSELAATLLRDTGVPSEKIFVYGGGMTEWSASGLPVEIAERNSGRFQGEKK